MEIQIRQVGKYRDVEVILDNNRVALGLKDADECLALAIELKDAISNLLDKDAYDALMACEM